MLPYDLSLSRRRSCPPTAAQPLAQPPATCTRLDSRAGCCCPARLRSASHAASEPAPPAAARPPVASRAHRGRCRGREGRPREPTRTLAGRGQAVARAEAPPPARMHGAACGVDRREWRRYCRLILFSLHASRPPSPARAAPRREGAAAWAEAYAGGEKWLRGGNKRPRAPWPMPGPGRLAARADADAGRKEQRRGGDRRDAPSRRRRR